MSVTLLLWHSEHKLPDVYRRTLFHQVQRTFFFSLLCQDVVTKDCYLSTKWEHSYSGFEDNWLSACLCCLSDSPPFRQNGPLKGPMQELLRLQQQSSRPPMPITSLHRMIKFVVKETVCVCSEYACVCRTVLGTFKCLFSCLCMCDNLQASADCSLSNSAAPSPLCLLDLSDHL